MQTKLGYPDVGCAGTFTGQYHEASGDALGSFSGTYTGDGFWLWVSGCIAWLVLTVIGTSLQVARVYRVAWAEKQAEAATISGGESLDRPERRLGRMRSNSEPDLLRSDSAPAGMTRQRSGSVAGQTRAGIKVTRLLMGLTSIGLTALTFIVLAFMMAGDAVYRIDFRWVVVAAMSAAVLAAVLAVWSAHGPQRPPPSAPGQLQASGSPPRPTSIFSTIELLAPVAPPPPARGGYQLFVCDRPLTWVLTVVGTAAVAMVGIAVLTTASHMQVRRNVHGTVQPSARSSPRNACLRVPSPTVVARPASPFVVLFLCSRSAWSTRTRSG